MSYLHRIFIILSSLLCVTSTFAAQSAPAAKIYTEEMQTIVVTPEQPQFVIHLKSNPTTGYSWFLRTYDTNLLTPVSHHFQVLKKGLIGAPGEEEWVFKVKPAGFIVPQQTTLRFIYMRPWQGNEQSNQQVFHISIQAR